MKVTVRLFAGHRERAGCARVGVELADGACVGDAFGALTVRYPALAETASFTTFARNRRVVETSEPLEDGDELALLQPVSGGEPALIEIIDAPLSVDKCIAMVAAPGCGGVVTFLGTVRDSSDGRATDHLEYEAFAEMAGEVVGAIVDEAQRRWMVRRVAVQHRTGELEIGAISVIVAVSAPHRAEAFEACRYIIDELKTRAPIWKKEYGPTGEVWK